MVAVAGALACASAASAQVTFFEDADFSGRSITVERSMGNFDRAGFNDRASSAIVRGGWWEVCEDARFSGQCVTLRPGSYTNFASMGLNDRVSSVRPLEGRGHDRQFMSDNGYDYRRRNNERVYEAQVTSVRAVVGPPEQRCWVERQAVTTNQGDYNIPGAIVGGIVGGILGHQIGGGRGQDIATGVGAVGGAAVGANVGRGYGNDVVTQDVQRCTTTPHSGRPDYWDVTYNFRGYEHRVQLTSPPGNTILVNDRGEPRV
jgi:uncharacterized protein YcfJ